MTKTELLNGLKWLEKDAVMMQGGGDPEVYEENVAKLREVAKNLRKVVRNTSMRTIKKLLG